MIMQNIRRKLAGNLDYNLMTKTRDDIGRRNVDQNVLFEIMRKTSLSEVERLIMNIDAGIATKIRK